VTSTAQSLRLEELTWPTVKAAIESGFDPIVLAELGVFGLTGDPVAARTWYQKAMDSGSTVVDWARALCIQVMDTTTITISKLRMFDPKPSRNAGP